MNWPCFVSIYHGLRVTQPEVGILWDYFCSVGDLHGLVVLGLILKVRGCSFYLFLFCLNSNMAVPALYF